MDAYKVSAQFVAYTWFMKHNAVNANAVEAMQFARNNWAFFLPSAHEGLGRLLIRIARPKQKQYGRPLGRVFANRVNLKHAAAG
jgi:hypothetical protein